MDAYPGLHLNFADLNGGLDVGVVGNVGQDRLRVRGEGGLEGVGRVEIEVAHRDIYRGRSRRAAGDALFNRQTFAGGAKLLLHHRHVLVEIIVHVEPAARRVGVEYAHFDQAFLLDSDDSCQAAPSTPESGQRADMSACPLCAKSGLTHRSNRLCYSITAVASKAAGTLRPSILAVWAAEPEAQATFS